MVENLGPIDAELAKRLRDPDGRSGTYKDVVAFRNRIDEWFKDVIENYAPQVHKRIALEGFAGLVRATPVGNKATWKRNLGKPPNKHQPKFYVGGQARKSWRIDVGGSAAGPAVQDPLSVLARAKTADLIRIGNPLPYMERLNNGWSRQAPAGFVEQVLSQVAAKYQRVR